MKSISDAAVLNNGVKMPWVGLGVYKMTGDNEVENAVRAAIEHGYRSIDTAALYNNEPGVGQAVKQCGIPREQLFVTTKVWNTDQGYESTLKAFEQSQKKLGLDYLDLYLVHWPISGKYVETWKALLKLYRDGLVRAIGVSNFQIRHLQDVMHSGDVVPAVNQVEYHPLLTQRELRDFCRDNGIQLEAWSPLMRGNLDHAVLHSLAEKYGKTPAQIVLRWDIQNEVVTIPKSSRESRIRENAAVFDFELSQEDMLEIDGLNKNHRFGPDPDTF